MNGTQHSKGGYGVVEVDTDTNNIIWQFQDFKSPTTNNEMELMAILTALQHIDKTGEVSFLRPTIYTDSAYTVNLINDWMYHWQRNEWKRQGNQEVKNLGIIKQIYDLADIAVICKIPGHSGIYWNEYADSLATGKIKI